MATSTDLRAAIQEVQSQLPEDQLVGEGVDELLGADLTSRIEQRVGALPWWVISSVVHAVLFLMCTLIGVAMPAPQLDEVAITTDVAKKEEPKYDQKKKRDIFRNPQEVEAENQVENPVVVHEETEVSDHFETENDMDSQNARGQEDAISDIPLGGTGVTGVMGVGGGGMAGCFGYRDGGGRKRATARFGGSPATESAVEAALRWLARHQEKEGHWDGSKWEGKNYPGGLTGLAVLAFLGAGYTHKSGKFRDNVARGIKALVSRQDASGAIGARGAKFGYEHSIGGLALAEAYGMSRDPELKGPAQKAVDFSISKHQVPYSGWRYHPKQSVDTSVTGWFVMQLKSARVAGLRVDNSGFQGATQYLDKVTSKGGAAGYTGMGKSGRGYSMTAVGMVCRQFMGAMNTDPLLVGGAGELKGKLPKWPAEHRVGFYYWYYGTLAMFQMGGEHWKKWNGAMKKTLLDNQRKGGPLDGSAKDVDGSWDPLKQSDEAKGGRVYTTALGALSLEVYYRYLPMYTK